MIRTLTRALRAKKAADLSECFFFSTYADSFFSFFFQPRLLQPRLQVVHTVATSEIEKQAVYCRCWKSGTVSLFIFDSSTEKAFFAFAITSLVLTLSFPLLFPLLPHKHALLLFNSSPSATAPTSRTTPRRETTSGPSSSRRTEEFFQRKRKKATAIFFISFGEIVCKAFSSSSEETFFPFLPFYNNYKYETQQKKKSNGP